MYDVRPNSIIGFHGCDLSIRNRLITDPNTVELSNRPYDWLSNGFYFWENNYTRAQQWAEDKAAKGEIANPAVVGTVLQLGNCCDFLDSNFPASLSFTIQQWRQNISLPINLCQKM